MEKNAKNQYVHKPLNCRRKMVELGISPHPAFKDNRYLYLSKSRGDGLLQQFSEISEIG